LNSQASDGAEDDRIVDLAYLGKLICVLNDISITSCLQAAAKCNGSTLSVLMGKTCNRQYWVTIIQPKKLLAKSGDEAWMRLWNELALAIRAIESSAAITGSTHPD
jgi:hypothetical protein